MEIRNIFLILQMGKTGAQSVSETTLMLPQPPDYETGNANLDQLDSEHFTEHWARLFEPSRRTALLPNPCKTSCAFLPVHIEAPKSLASHRKFLSGCLLITFQFILACLSSRGTQPAPYTENLCNQPFWCGRGPAGETALRGSLACGDSGNGHTPQNLTGAL